MPYGVSTAAYLGDVLESPTCWPHPKDLSDALSQAPPLYGALPMYSLETTLFCRYSHHRVDRVVILQ